MGKKSKKKSGRDEDSNVNGDFIPEDAREIIQNLQEILTLHSEQEIYAMLLECKMNPNEAITRLLSQDSFQEVKSKRSKKKEAMEKKALMGLNADNVPEIMREEESSLNADNVPENSIEILQKLKEVVNCSEQESYNMLVKCNMNPDEAVNSLLSQDSIQQVESKQDEKKETKDTSDCQGVRSSESSDQNHEFTNGGDSYVGQYGGNKFNSDDTSKMQGIRNHVAGSSTTSGILGPPPLNSFKKNREERVRKRDEDSKANNIPEDARKIVQELEIITLHSEQEMDPQEAITRLLSQGFFDEVSSFFMGLDKL